MTTDLEWVTRPWGQYCILMQTPNMWVKQLVIRSGHRLSLQSHTHRHESWTVFERGLKAVIGGEHLDLHPAVQYNVPASVLHRIENPTRYDQYLVEVANGLPDEEDIIRYDDDYERE